MPIPIPYDPVQGKTYSLFGINNSTLPYYQRINDLTNQILKKCNDLDFVLQTIRQFSRKKLTIQSTANNITETNLISFIIHLLNSSLAEYTQKVDSHLKTLPITKLWDRRLATTRGQYHLYMLEIELTNRLNIEKFRNAEKKIALLPYCLRDFNAVCKSTPDTFDYQCKHCSKYCYQHYISRILKEHHVDAYIWRGADIKKGIKKAFGTKLTIAVLGIACIPELIFGMRKCQKHGLPAIGVPLDGNCCIRWMGEFNRNSINLDQLELLITNRR